MKEIKITTVMSLALAVAISVPVAAQQPAKTGQEKQPAKQMMSRDEMMKECRRHCQEMRKSVDQTKKMLDEAERSNDPARRQAAIDQARKSLAEMKNRMSRCVEIMDMMEKMHGKGQKKQPEETVSRSPAPNRLTGRGGQRRWAGRAR
jgi:hypothetical protein